MRIAVLMPAFNEAGRLASTLDELAAALPEATRACVFLVDDGSVPPIDEATVRAAAKGLRIVIARHPVNLGQGAALETARRLALEPRWQPEEGSFEAFVTMDSDGQHGGGDVLALADAIAAGADVALGDRFAGGSDVPTSRRALLAFARAFERATTGLRLSDAHNGLRAFGPRAIARMRIRQNRMAHATEISRAISRASAERLSDDPLRVVEVPVSVRYTGESLAKGQRASGAVTIVVDLFHGFLFSEPRGPDDAGRGHARRDRAGRTARGAVPARPRHAPAQSAAAPRAARGLRERRVAHRLSRGRSPPRALRRHRSRRRLRALPARHLARARITPLATPSS